MQWVLAGIALIAANGLPGSVLPRRSMWGQWLSVLLAVAGSAAGLAGAIRCALRPDEAQFRYAWSLLPTAEIHLELDAISAVFLGPVLLISALGAVYGLGYWKQCEHAANGRKLRLFYGLCAAGMAVLVLARNSILFLLGWEAMALAAFMLVATEDDQAPARRAGWVYLVATHLATLCLFAVFGLFWSLRGDFEWPAAGELPASATANALFLLALVGFGFKAGLMPLHFWLPAAHANAPSHVSALMSGVLIKMGVYGLVRVGSFFSTPPVWWGGTLLALGVVSGVLGIACAVGQADLKRLMAYSSVENIGIIAIGLGLALVGRARTQNEWIALGLAGSLVHVWNHSLFKPLLFFAAGSVLHAVETREMDALGGLVRRLPTTAFCFVIGAAAICGLPPLNGFVGEFVLYNGLFRTLGFGGSGGGSWTAAAFGAPALGFIGALAVVCYVKAFGTVFLGTGRSERSKHAHESPPAMTAPMLTLAAACVAFGLVPNLVVPLADGAVRNWLGAPWDGDAAVPSLRDLVEVGTIGRMGWLLLAAMAGTAAWLAFRVRSGAVEPSCTWGCGYTAPSPRMQYTASSFAELLGALFGWALWPRASAAAVHDLFPRASAATAAPETAERPLRVWRARAMYVYRGVQRGSIQSYLLYIFAILLFLLIWQ